MYMYVYVYVCMDVGRTISPVNAAAGPCAQQLTVMETLACGGLTKTPRDFVPPAGRRLL